VLGNFALTQAQAIIVGFLASVGAIVLKVITEKEFLPKNELVLIAGSVSTASFASLILAGLMMFVIIISKRFNINPDNIATPIAASLGDLVTLLILSALCTILYKISKKIIKVNNPEYQLIITFFVSRYFYISLNNYHSALLAYGANIRLLFIQKRVCKGSTLSRLGSNHSCHGH
jgi:hypothetical protein